MVCRRQSLWISCLVMAYTFCRDVQQIWHTRWMRFSRPLTLDKCFSVCSPEKGSHGITDCIVALPSFTEKRPSSLFSWKWCARDLKSLEVWALIRDNRNWNHHKTQALCLPNFLNELIATSQVWSQQDFKASSQRGICYSECKLMAFRWLKWKAVILKTFPIFWHLIPADTPVLLDDASVSQSSRTAHWEFLVLKCSPSTVLPFGILQLHCLRRNE